MQEKSKYIYGIIRYSKPKNFLYAIINFIRWSKKFGCLGIGRSRLYQIRFNDIVAVVSNSPIKKTLKASREDMIIHARVLEEIMKKHTLLPARFGIIAENTADVKWMLKQGYSDFVELLEKVEGKKELSVSVFFNKEDIYKDLLEKYEKLRTLKEKIAKLPREKAHAQHITIGKMIAACLDKEKELHKKAFLDFLVPLAVDVKNNENYDELIILNSAFLITKEMEAQFNEKVEELDKIYGGKLRFKLITAPPFNFTNLKIIKGKNVLAR